MDIRQKKALQIIENTYDMYERTKKDVERRMKDDLNEDGSKKYSDEEITEKLNEIQEAQDDVIQQYVETGGDVNDLYNRQTKKKTSAVKKLKNMGVDTKKDTTTNTKKTTTKVVEEPKQVYIPKKRDYKSNVAYDVIPLPSKGQVYRHKTDRLQVAYLTAHDENMFVSPNLYRDGLLIDFLLNDKILEAGIDPSELLDGDRDAIILWLRATGYGNEFPITATDNETKTEFEAIIDLSKIKFKEFNLEGDENGFFSFTLPMSKDEVKFKFLNHRETEELKRMEVSDDRVATKRRLTAISEDLRRFLDVDDSLVKAQKSKLYEACRSIEDWYESMDEDEYYYTNTITNRLTAQVVSINGNTNRGFIEEYVYNMNVKDSLELRKYITENEPGLDFKVEINKPESLGGGSQTVFLPLDQFIFLNLA